MVRLSPASTRISTYMRSAFTMIELIFAIVVIAVVMLTIPMMIQVNNKGLEANVGQEAIFVASSILSEATTWLWDNNSLPNDGNVSLSRILDVNGTGNVAYDRININSSIRVGGLEEDMHRQFYSEYNATSTRPARAATDTTPPSNSFDTTAAGEQLGLKSQYDVNVTVTYVDDTPNTIFQFLTTSAGVQTNILMTNIEIGGNDVDSKVVLRAYTCNIGEIDYAKRRF